MFRRFLSLPPAPASARGPLDETDTVRTIVSRLESLPPEQAKLLAAASYILGRAANADLEISDVETRAMEEILVEQGLADEAQAVLVVEMAKLQVRAVGGTEDFLVTREFREHSTPEQRLAILRACFVVAAADDEITSAESDSLAEIANELGIEREDLRLLRAGFADKLVAVRLARQASRRP